MKPSDFISDETMQRTFFTSALLTLGAIAVPVLGPIGLTGMIGSQSLFWGKRIAKRVQEEDAL